MRQGCARIRLGALAVLLVTVPACGSADEGRLNVFAASSLTDAFTELRDTFEASHPSLEVAFNFAASSTLAQQIDSGSHADVFVAADERTMKTVVDAGHARRPEVVARNRMVLLVERGNPKSIRNLADLTDPGVVFVACAPRVPCGRLASAVLRRAGVDDARPASLEDNARAVVAKVQLGEADAGLAYATDVMAAPGSVDGIELDTGDEPSLQAVYLAAVTTDASDRRAARAWIAALRSRQGRSVLAGHGFVAP